MMAEVRAEAAQLYADHDAMARTLREREPARRAEVDEVLARQSAAYAAEDQAWQALDDADQALRDNPADPELVEAFAAAAATYRAARDQAHAVGEQVTAVTRRHLEEVAAESAALLELGNRFRAAQDETFQPGATTQEGPLA
ncbi:hypothetical protein AWW66_25290 [Micromonospora rosaria]|uniref:Uncharacterized protein n=2 Tax=Micromonospora rosaria TaxID=47874 RepID=A0A136PLJ7_9ACTN|nr:hypothetical protein AWW66_25290 [Micromonospora rosaria]